jgi:predicted phage terminase large subunit-like protein
MSSSFEKAEHRDPTAEHRDPTNDEFENEWASRSLIRFTKRTFPEYRPGWFHEAVARIADQFLAAVAEKKSPRWMLTAPPQHGKSELISRRLPAFALGRNPDLRIIATSYAADLVYGFSSDVQHIMDSERYHQIFPGTRIVGQFAKAGTAKRSAGLFEVVGRRGRYRAAGVGGGITGEPADILINDDLIKDFSDAMSSTIRNATFDWFTSTALTRLQEGGGAIMMATRWHEDDPLGRLLRTQADRWTVINFPAIAEHDEPHRRMGEPLSIERFSLESLLQKKADMGSYQWNALYQQRPSPLGGGIFKRDDWRFYREPPATFDFMVQSWDCAFKDKSTSDFVVGQVWLVKGADKYLVDQVRGHFSFGATVNAIRSLSAKWPKADRKLVEDKANGTAVIETLQHEISGIIAVEPAGGKEARAHAVSSEVEANNIYLPENRSWVHDFIEECAAFPTGAHDDQVDAMTQALIRIREISASRNNSGFYAVGQPKDPEFCVERGWIKKAFRHLK